ncbi:MAG: guanylate kinase [Desulfobulbaceae bacterium A2]|nr:MAG: guanylate kinase [Desulfobulbaceae bacterium A2]
MTAAVPQSPALLFVVSAPSGAGKSTLLGRVMPLLPALGFSVSHTTRAPRPGEQSGREYHFVSRDEFLALRDQQPAGFLEWAEVHGNLYGTSRAEVEGRLAAGQDVILDIDVQGARQLRGLLPAVFIFIAPPSAEELSRRLRGRGTEAEETVRLRLANARQELLAVPEYDYLVVNESLDAAADQLHAIILAERSRQRRDVAGRLRWPLPA